MANTQRKRCHLPWMMASLMTLTGCASVTSQHTMDQLNADTQGVMPASVRLLESTDQRVASQQAVNALLQSPLTQTNAVQVMLLGSPAFQTLLAQGVASAANAAQSGRIANPSVSIERMSSLSESELTRVLSFGLLDVLTLPTKHRLAQQAVQQSQAQLASDVVQRVQQTRQAWVRAVAAKQNLAYAQQVMRSANASAELAARLQRVGNINVLARAKQHMYAADAVVALATAQHANTSAHESLIRLLGLRPHQADLLQLPDRLPDLPKQVLTPQDVGQHAMSSRFDIRLAQHGLEASGIASGLGQVSSLVDVEWSVRRSRSTDAATSEVARSAGNELSVRLPVFDWGDAQRTRLNAQALAAINLYEHTLINAVSELRESYSAYRTTLDIAQHYQQAVLPLRALMSEENQYRYNGMLLGTLDLLADARAQVAVVKAALAANEQFWLAEAALHAHLLGSPFAVGTTSPNVTSAADDAVGH